MSKSARVGIDLVDVESDKKSGRSRRRTLEWWKAYLDSCASYHTFFSKVHLKSIKEGGGTMTGNCNAGTTHIRKKGYFGDLQVWLNEQGVANLISISMLKKDGYSVSKTTTGEWKVVTPGGDTIPFKRDKGLTVGMPYIDLREHQEGLAFIETIRKNMAGFTPQEIEKAKLSRETQGHVGHPPDGVLKQMIGEKDLKNDPVSLDDVAKIPYQLLAPMSTG